MSNMNSGTMRATAVDIINASQTRINPATEDKQSDTLSDYKIADIDADASPNYYGFLRKDGAWYIIKETISAGADTYRYVSGSSGYNWANRASETYTTFDSAF